MDAAHIAIAAAAIVALIAHTAMRLGARQQDARERIERRLAEIAQ